MISSVSNLWFAFFMLATLIIAFVNKAFYHDYNKKHQLTPRGKLLRKGKRIRLLRFAFPPIKSDMDDRFKTTIFLQYMFICVSVAMFVAGRIKH
jgi:hypothetical protein